jgi:Phage terminase large subunit
MGVRKGELDFKTFIENLPRAPKQHKFLAAENRMAAIVGGRGSGKSVVLCISAQTFAANDPNGMSLIGRLNMPALETSTMQIFLELVEEGWGDWQDSKKIFQWKNGHQTIFKHLDITDPKVVGHIKSMNLSAAFIDEAVEISEEIYFVILGGVRRKTAPRRIIRLASNPAGHDWVWRHFFDPNRKKALQDNLGITMSSMDNVFLPEETIENMLNTYPPDWAERFIYGSFADFSDLIFKEFSEVTHVWDETKEWDLFGGAVNPPPDWPVIVGMDIGGGEEGDPWAIPIIAVAPDGRLFQYDEVYGSGLRIKPISEEMHAKIGSHPIEGIAYDYAQRAAAMELEEHGIYGQPALKEVTPGLFKTEQYMHVDPRLVHPFNPTVNGSPRYFISSRCRHTLRELPAYKWAKDRSGNPKFEPAHENSHCPSAIRYAIHTFRPEPEKIAPQKAWQNPALNEISRLYWYEVDKHRRDGEKTKEPVQFQRSRFTRFIKPAVLRSRQ